MTSREATALIGYTGFVGGNLLAQREFDARYNSANIEEIAGRSFDLIVCAGAPAEKWKANADPERDLANIERLSGALTRARAGRVVLLSTVDVFGSPVGVDEESWVPTDGLHAYGRHRRLLEERIAGRFDTTIARLPGLFGPGLKKNVIFDFLHDNDVHKIDSRGVFQFYDTTRLWHDVEIALRHRLPLVHLPTEPVSVADLARAAFGIDFDNRVVANPARYDMRTRHATLFGGTGPYIENATRVLERITAYVARERSGGGDLVKLAVSNIAWDTSADDAAAAVLVREGALGVELAPTKWRDAPYDAPAEEIAALRTRWEDRGLPIIGLQSLLFGRPDLQLLAGDRERAALIDYLRRVADFAAAVGARSLVFGSPKNRVRGSRSIDEAMGIARDAFRILAAHARERSVVFCVEANPPEYGGDFITRTSDAVELCRLVDDPSIRVNADLGGMMLSGEDPAEAIARAAPYVAHVHASEPHLVALSTISAHERAASSLAGMDYSGWVSIEMRAPASGDQIAALERAIEIAKRAYGEINS